MPGFCQGVVLDVILIVILEEQTIWIYAEQGECVA